ncbi:MAG TPA: lipoyl(octanoyl) transferase LipB [Candidatus Binatia bacterium]
MSPLRWSYLGRVEYDAARELQSRLAATRAARGCDDLLLLLEHPPVLTLGRHATAPPTAPWPVVRTDRGGDVTYHGPGQLVGYPVVALRSAGRGVRAFVAALEAAMCDVAAACGVEAYARAGLPGVWSGSPARKLGAIGLAVHRGVTLHGCALNVDARAERGFDGVDPCGMRGVAVTSLTAEGAPADVTPESIAPLLAERLAYRLGLEACRADDAHAILPTSFITAATSHGHRSAS